MPEGARPASNWILRFSPAQCAEHSFCRAPYSAQGNNHRAAGVPEVQGPPRIGSCGFLRRAPDKAFAALRIPPQGNIHRAAGVLEGARPASNQIMRFFRRNAQNKAFAALRIPHKGTSTERRECPRCKTRLELDSTVFSGAMRRTKLLPRYVFRTREHPQSSGSARGARPASNWIMRFFRRNAPNKAFAALRIPHKGTSTEQRGCSRGQDPPRIRSCGF